MLRFIVSEQGQPALPAVDIDAPVIVIGSAVQAQIRLPASAARGAHVRIEGTQWSEGATKGAIGSGHVFAIGAYRVEVAPAPAGSVASPPQRTESLARELIRGMLGTGSDPALAIETGPSAGSRRSLAPPESVLAIGRGDDADWVIPDEDLSRMHAEIRRGWDGTVVRDLDSQNGTRVDGKRIDRDVPLRDGARISLGRVVLVFTDPADRQLAKPVVLAAAAPTRAPFVIAIAIAALAIAGLVWVLTS